VLLLLLFLAIVPVVAYRYARRRHPNHLFLISGVALGSIIEPFSLGLYATYFIPYIGLVPGMLGLFAAMFHGTPGHKAALYLGIIPPQVVEGISHLYLAAVNAAIWGAVYGCVGWVIDRIRTRRANDG
jgi:hypothetical protein